MATLRGESVDRPPVSFYEIGGWKLDPDDSDPYNVFSGPGWRELIRLAEEETDLIRLVHPQTTAAADNPMTELRRVETWEQDGSRFTRVTLDAGDRTLTSLSRRDRDVATTWELEHLLKTPEDAEAYLRLPDEAFAYDVDVDNLVAAEEDLGDAGIVMVDYGDPLCVVAGLFSMADYTVLALTEPALFHRLLEKVAQGIYRRWRPLHGSSPAICGVWWDRSTHRRRCCRRDSTASMPRGTHDRWSKRSSVTVVSRASTRTVGCATSSRRSPRWGPMDWIHWSLRRRAI